MAYPAPKKMKDQLEKAIEWLNNLPEDQAAKIDKLLTQEGQDDTPYLVVGEPIVQGVKGQVMFNKRAWPSICKALRCLINGTLLHGWIKQIYGYARRAATLPSKASKQGAKTIEENAWQPKVNRIG